MSKNILVRNYCEALLKESKNDFGKIKKEIAAILELLILNTDLQNALVSNIFKESTKIKILRVLFDSNDFSIQIQNFLLLLIKHKRFSLFIDIAHQFSKLSISGTNIISAKVTSSAELSDAQKSDIIAMLESKFNNKFEITTYVNPEILGGLVIEYGSMLLDLSLKGQMDMIYEQSKLRLQTLHYAL